MPLLQHLNELRRRVFVAFGTVMFTTLLSFGFAELLIDIFAAPIGGKEALVSIEVTENVAIFMRVSLLSGLVLSMPVVIYQVLRFVLPGLQGSERLWIILGVVFGSLLFVGGVAFTWYVMIPVAVTFLTTFLDIPTNVRPLNYFEFVTKLLFWIGVFFEMPLVVMILAKFKFVTAGQLLSGWRYALVIMAVIAAVITPTVDPVNMGLVMLPLSGLYLISIILAALVGRD